jgi:TfoX/Sxy family transcriptional regulator of competence genes
MPYWELPEDVARDDTASLEWARLSIAIASGQR